MNILMNCAFVSARLAQKGLCKEELPLMRRCFLNEYIDDLCFCFGVISPENGLRDEEMNRTFARDDAC